jgi:phosphoglycerate dehydrogenase-like enzyme
MILSLLRRIPQETASLRAGGWQTGLGRGLAGKTLGVLGLGSMGLPVARIGQGFGMNVVAWSPNLTPERTAEHGVECVLKADLFTRSDILTIHIPHSDSTQGIIRADDIASMKRSAYLINTSRPKLIDNEALVQALTSGQIAGAGLDVFEIEPLPLNHPFRTLPNVIATPHIGFVTEENYRMFFEQSLENLIAFQKDRPIRTISSERPFLPDSQVVVRMHGERYEL